MSDEWAALLGEWESLEAAPKSSAHMLMEYAPKTCAAVAALLGQRWCATCDGWGEVKSGDRVVACPSCCLSPGVD